MKKKKLMNVLLLVLVLVIFSILVSNWIVDNSMKFIISARISELTTTTRVTVRSVVYDVAVGCLQNTVNPGNQISTNLTVTNFGTYQGDMQILWWIEDSSGHSLNISGSSSINVLPGYTWTSIKVLSLPSSVQPGNYYVKSNVTAPGFYGTAHCSFEVVSPVATITPIQGSSAGGSISQPPVTKETVTVSNINEGEEGTFNYKNPEILVSRISVSTVNDVQNAKVSVSKGSCGDEAGSISGSVYQFLCIEKENIQNADIKEVKILFKIEKSWIDKNEISLSSISLYRYANGWNELSTDIMNEDTNYIYFEAKTYGLSTFSIVGKKIGGMKQVDISYTSSISAFVNSTKRIYIQVKNNEDESLNNLKLILQGLELSWFSIIPENTILNPHTTQEFSIEITIPPEAPTKTYPVNLVVKSDEFEETVKININVLKILPKENIQEKIKELEDKIVSSKNRVEELGRSGVQIITVERLLNVAEEKLDEAKIELQSENYGKASEILNDVEGIVNDIDKTLFGGSFGMRSLNIVLIAIVSVVLTALFVGRIRLLLGETTKMTVKRKWGIFDKLKFMFSSTDCPKGHRKMQQMYKDNKLIGYRCTKCGYTKYRRD
ncbi:MAG: PGF-pre-PGF domain-containing protein [Candidatus Aenigmatarchaeota archaeon]